MKINKSLFLFSLVFVFLSFTSCKDERKAGDMEDMEMETEREAQRAEEDRLEQDRMEWEENNVFARVHDNSELSTFSQSIDSAAFADSFTDREGSYTIFAPNNAAYGNLNQQEREGMMKGENRNTNMAMLHYLVVEDELTSEELLEEIENANGNYSLTTMQGETITASLQGENIVLKDAAGNTATIIQADNDASNGVIHVIDKILKPKDASKNAAGTSGNNTGTQTGQNLQ